jgi:hypothetical protein
MDVHKMMSTDKDFLKKNDLIEMILEKTKKDVVDLHLEDKIRLLYDEIQMDHEIEIPVELVLKEIVEKKKLLLQKEKEVNPFRFLKIEIHQKKRNGI